MVCGRGCSAHALHRRFSTHTRSSREPMRTPCAFSTAIKYEPKAAEEAGAAGMQAALATAPKTADRKHGRGGKGWGRLRPGGRARSEKDHAWEQIQRRQQHRKAMQQHRKTTPPTRLPRAARPSATRSHASDRAGCGLSGALLVRLARSTCVCALLPPPPRPSLSPPAVRRGRRSRARPILLKTTTRRRRRSRLRGLPPKTPSAPLLCSVGSICVEVCPCV